MNYWKYFIVGLKLGLILILASIISLILYLIILGISFLITYLTGIVLFEYAGLIISLITGIIVDGYLIIRYRKWLFKGVNIYL